MRGHGVREGGQGNTGQVGPAVSVALGAPVRGRRAAALAEPVRQIAMNAGLDGSVVLEKVRSGKSGTGFDAYNETYVDMVKEGIVDPTKVTRTALENAASIASVLLTTEALVADKPEPPAPAAAPNPDMGMY